jgi:hypothetical protein
MPPIARCANDDHAILEQLFEVTLARLGPGDPPPYVRDSARLLFMQGAMAACSAIDCLGEYDAHIPLRMLQREIQAFKDRLGAAPAARDA